MNKKSRVIIVEGERPAALALKQLLEEEGFVIALAHDGEAALERVRREPFDVILMDIDLGTGMDGIETARALQEKCSTPVVFVSSPTDPHTVAEAREVSPYGFLEKGATGFALAQALLTAIELHQRLEQVNEGPGGTPGEPSKDNAADGTYLKDELYSLIQTDHNVFEFLEAGSLDGIWYWDILDPAKEWLSPGFWRTFGYDPAEKKHLASEWQDMIHPEDLQTALENFRLHLEDPSHPYDQVVRYEHKNGSTVWVRCRGLAIRDEAGNPIRMLGAHNDLTKQMEAHAQQVALVREMNHRVRNNLAVLDAMIGIELGESGKSREDSLEDISARLRAIMLVHEQLYQSGEHADIEVESYLRSLVDSFVQASSNKIRGLSIDLEAPALFMKAGRVSKVGMIISELLANTVKHATPREGAPQRINLRVETGDGIATARYSDYGVLPDHVRSIEDMQAGTGMTVIRAMVQDLQGTISLVPTEETTTFVLSFALEPAPEAEGGVSREERKASVV